MKRFVTRSDWNLANSSSSATWRWRQIICYPLITAVLFIALLHGLNAGARYWITRQQTQVAQNLVTLRQQLAAQENIQQQLRLFSQQMANVPVKERASLLPLSLLNAVTSSPVSGIYIETIRREASGIRMVGNATQQAQIQTFLQYFSKNPDWQTVQLQEINETGHFPGRWHFQIYISEKLP